MSAHLPAFKNGHRPPAHRVGGAFVAPRIEARRVVLWLVAIRPLSLILIIAPVGSEIGGPGAPAAT